jgi:hypothetical protein
MFSNTINSALSLIPIGLGLFLIFSRRWWVKDRIEWYKQGDRLGPVNTRWHKRDRELHEHHPEKAARIYVLTGIFFVLLGLATLFGILP